MSEYLFLNFPLETLAVIAVLGIVYTIVLQAMKSSPQEEFDQSLAKLAKSLTFAYKKNVDGLTFSLIRDIPSLARLSTTLYSAMKGNHRGVEINHFYLSFIPERPRTSCVVIRLEKSSIHDFQLIQKEHYSSLSQVFLLESEVYTYKLPVIDGTHLLFTNTEKETIKLLDTLFHYNLDLLTHFSFIVENNYLILFDYENLLQVPDLAKVFRHSVEVYEALSSPDYDVQVETILSLQPDHCVEPYYPYGTEYLTLANESRLGYADFWKLERTPFLDDLPLLTQSIRRIPYDNEPFYPATNIIWGKHQKAFIYLADRSMPNWSDFHGRSHQPAYAGSPLEPRKNHTFCIIVHPHNFIVPFTLIPKYEVNNYELTDKDILNIDEDEVFSSQYELMTPHQVATKKVFNKELRTLLYDQALTIECNGNKTAIFHYLKVIPASERKKFLELVTNIFSKLPDEA